MIKKHQGKAFTVNTVDNGFIIYGHRTDADRLGVCADDTAVARSASEAKAVLRELFEEFLDGLNLT